MKALEESVRAIEQDGLVWGGGKLVAVGFGIKKLQINVVIEDDKVSLDELQQKIEEIEDYVQSTDVVSSIPSPVSCQFTRTTLIRASGCYAKVVDHLVCSLLRYTPFVTAIINPHCLRSACSCVVWGAGGHGLWK